VSIRRDPAGNLKPDKERSTGRIDGVVAAVMGVGMASRRVSTEPTITFLSWT
jgi:phage terminase large subunit-like protein